MAKKQQKSDFDPIPKEDLGKVICLIFAKIIEKSRNLAGSAGRLQRAFYRAHQQFPDLFAHLLFDRVSSNPRSEELADNIFRMKVAGLLQIQQQGRTDKLYMEPDAIQEIIEKYYDVEVDIPDGLIDVLVQELTLA